MWVFKIKIKAFLPSSLSVFPKLSTINFFICIKIFSFRDICQNDRNSNSRTFFIQAKNVRSIKCRRGNRLPYKVYKPLRNNIDVCGRSPETHTALTMQTVGTLILLSATLRKGVSAPRTAALPSPVPSNSRRSLTQPSPQVCQSMQTPYFLKAAAEHS